jgi:hypothetical protein
VSKLIGVLILSVATWSIANADNNWWNPGGGWGDHHWCYDGKCKTPEIDPASAIGALTVLAGGLAVLRGRRTKNKK